ncbi:uncharacterized protein Z518_09914 [Rhinocladiella mackenziei CBS 650.93]|uniref:DNA replication checkpoint mediator MRC1 domain-containing protein n=1 Tax=Rhinocladiella mackenziei CBS 650.93 TaxID=1442369 RepID=A0A0D2I4W5_9EURO|nr:uncharacterized protein Z518_09914 [Rhinocladiella mackenziei CBS 650.93]KIX00849.1 hypothetical protein Z518_09914 [Rhinocladiella mackenziei CBS 650.93]
MFSSPRSPSSAGSPQSTASNALTPSRKIQSLLAQFDESDSDTPAHRPQAGSIGHSEQTNPVQPARARSPVDDGLEEEDLPVVPRSRIAARLQGLSTTSNIATDEKDPSQVESSRPNTVEGSDGNGDVAVSGMSRRLLTTRKSSPIRDVENVHTFRSASPLFIPSPSATRHEATPIRMSDRSDSEDIEKPSAANNSRFLALVEKHRKQRLEKEAEEAAKREARIERLKADERGARQQRGSSPPDDNDEDSDSSDDEGAKKLSRQARPTRKASKKAIEEMNRETQRLSRNMQLAHQARTKKKITKDSLLARFNFPIPNSTSQITADGEIEDPTTGSSRAGSDTEAMKSRGSPPTSPMQEDGHSNSPKSAKGCAGDILHADRVDAVVGAATSPLRPPTILDKGKGRARSEDPIEHSIHGYPIKTPISQDLTEIQEPALRPSTKPFRSKSFWARAIKPGTDDSDSDLEVITSKGDMRKYAAFEHVPKRKAKEAPSHLALRSLAHLVGGEDRKHSMNAAEMEASLRKAARMQARREREQKIQELKAKGVMVQTAEEREREQQEVEDLLEKARKDAAEIQKREKALAKKEGNYSKDDLDDEESEDDEDFDEDDDGEISEDSDGDENYEHENGDGNLLDNQADEEDSAESEAVENEIKDASKEFDEASDPVRETDHALARKSRTNRVISDDEDEDVQDQILKSPQLPVPAKTPQSLSRSARKQIPGIQMSDDLPIGLTQAFAATMADYSQNQGVENVQEQDSLTMTMDLPSPNLAMVPRLQRLDSIDVITDSQPASQTQPLNINLSFSQSQRVPPSPASGLRINAAQLTPSQPQFEPTQDGGYALSPFAGNRFATETPQHPGAHSTIDTVVLPNDTQDSPIVQRKARLRRGHTINTESEENLPGVVEASAFDVIRHAAKRERHDKFDKSKSHARDAVDEAAEESEDEYAGLGGASDEDVNEEENEDDRKMIDEDTQVGVGDEARLAKLFADRERQQDEAAVSKLLKDITTGALRRKRGGNDVLDLSDEEDAILRRREAKRREFAKMRRELLKDEAVGKIAEDKKKEAFLRSIEDRQPSDDEEDFDFPETSLEDESQEKPDDVARQSEESQNPQSIAQLPNGDQSKRSLRTVGASKLNQIRRPHDRSGVNLNRRPATLAEIRESVSFLIEEPDSQAATIDLGLSDSDEEPEAYVNLDRHFQAAEADENADEGDDLGGFIVDDDGRATGESTFKKPAAPFSEIRAPFSERRTKDRPNVVNRLSILRQSSSSSASSASTKMAFYSASSSASGSFSKVPSLLRQATTNSSLGSVANRDENVSATGVVTNKTERGKASEEKEFVRKGSGGRRNAVNYRPTMKEEKMSQRAGIAKKSATKNKGVSGFLGGLFRQDSWT